MMKQLCYSIGLVLISMTAPAIGQQLPPEALEQLKKPGEKVAPRRQSETEGVPALEVPEPLQFERFWQGKRHCGINAMYTLLLLTHHDTTLDDLGRELTLPEEGASMEELKQLAARHGLDTVAVKSDPSNLDRLPFPFILHQSASKTGRGTRDHYVVVTGRNGVGEYSIIDGTTGALYKKAGGKLSAEWSGYALILPENGLISLSMQVMKVLLIPLMVGVAVLYVVLQRRAEARATTHPVGEAQVE